MTPSEQPERYYTKDEVNMLIQAAVAEAHEMDVDSMRKHNRTATIISMILGFICLALFLDGLLRILGIVPPFMDLDVNILDDIVEKVEDDVMPLIEPYMERAHHYIPGL
jgi:hypothetical protein|tara:strand:- start:1052 stop:1378 length:327 start_codon:yes stop_codon:yes gene_type:complete